jgi:hypothetical protein
LDAVGTLGGRVTVMRVEVWEVWVLGDFVEASEDLDSSYRTISEVFELKKVRLVALREL